MLDYLFFDAALAEHFTSVLRTEGVHWHAQPDDDGINVAVDEDVSDELLDRLEQLYDELMDQQRRVTMAEDAAQAAAVHHVGVQYTVADGQVEQVHLDPQLVSRLLREVSVEELQELIQSVADQVAGGGSSALCQQPR